MIVIEERRNLDVQVGREANLRVEREDIRFEDIAGDRVRIEVTVHNAGTGRSRPTLMRLESAPLGAFVPWRRLASLNIPALEPGESREIVTEVPRAHPAPLGSFDRVPPRKVLAAVSSPDRSTPTRGAGVLAIFDLLRRSRTGSGSGRVAPSIAGLAPDLFELLGRDQPYWAGNLNVFIGTRAVERHLAKALRIYPGRTNLAMFVVGGQRTNEAYAFELLGLPANWKAALHDMTHMQTLIPDPLEASIQEQKWVESDCGLLVMLAACPPADCRSGKVEVHVTRRSCGKTAVVEFDLDPAAQGTGCYVV